MFWVAMLAAITVSCNKDDAIPVKIEPEPEQVPGQYRFNISAGYATAESDEITTRATMDFNANVYYWDPGDQIGLFVTATGTTSPTLITNLPLVGTNSSQEAHTFFSGTLSLVQADSLKQGNFYDYYSYFPYNANVGAFPTDIHFQVPPSLTVTPNTFKPVNMDIPMVAEPAKNKPPVFYLDGVTERHHLLHLDYKHIMSYAAIEMDCNLTSQTITSIKITNQNGARISGIYTYDMITGIGNYDAAGSNEITITISGGLTVGGGDVIYVPMPVVNMSTHTLTFQFSASSSANTYVSTKTIQGADFQRGKIHKLKIAPAATYITSQSFTTTVEGYYYIEAWGGDGGQGGKGDTQTSGQSAGGVAQRIAGLYYLQAGTTLSLYIGSAGDSKPGGAQGGSGAGALGGSNGLSLGTGSGSGGSGGQGYKHSILSNWSGAGGGGGAATFVLTASNNTGATLICSGGGGGGGGGSGNSSGTGSNGGSGGSGGTGGSPSLSGNGGNAGNSGGAGATTFNSVANGNNGTNGGSGNAPGGGGGGGGGGYDYGGNGGIGGQSGANSSSRGGGGGKGGQSYWNPATASNPGYSLPTNSRANGTNGYVVITFIHR